MLREKVSLAASYIEITISMLLIVGILITSIGLLVDLKMLFIRYISGSGTISYDIFLADAIQLIIAIEFIKMLVKHTPGSTIDVILLAVARRVILEHTSSMDLLIEIISIAILFIIRKYFYYHIESKKELNKEKA